MTVEIKYFSKFVKDKSLFNLSVSKKKLFYDCAAKYKFCYIDKIPKKEQPFFNFGKFLHAVFENFHKILIDNPDLINNWNETLNQAWKDAIIKYKSKLDSEQIENAKQITREYKQFLLKNGVSNILAVEKPFYLTLNNQVLLYGYIDRIQIDPDGILHVVDYKTSKEHKNYEKTRKPKYLTDTFQLQTYCLALMLEDSSIQKMRGSFALLKYNWDFLTTEFAREQIMTIADDFFKCYTDIKEEKLWRENPTFLCNYCDYLNRCKKGMSFLKSRKLLKEDNEIPITGIRKW
jgi:putative RecB family exonuclease